MSARPLPSTVAHLDALAATGADGYLVISAPRTTGWVSRAFPVADVDAAAVHVAELDAAGLNVYVRTTLVGSSPEPGKRGSKADTSTAIALAVDLDVAGPGHRQGTAELPLPSSFEQAVAALRSALPSPSLIIGTGGGGHLWYILEEPVTTDPVGLVERWGAGIVALGVEHGIHIDRPDAARVLRVAGTHRRKPGVPVNRVEIIDVAGWPINGLAERPWCPAARYGATDLIEALPEPIPAQPPVSALRPTPTLGGFQEVRTVGPADAISRVPWSLIFEPLGWTLAGVGDMDGTPAELWQRPGASSTYSLKAIPDGPAVAWSDQLGLPTGVGLSKWTVYCHLRHGGDQSAAARAIRLAANGRAA